ncbi:MAG: Bax inhibitor-1/YccA family protein [Chthoniobacterales bacterium]
MPSSNPTLRPATFESIERSTGPVMSLSGTINRSAILLLLVILGASFTWSNTSQYAQILTFGGAIAGFILAMVTIFKMQWSPYTSPVYALCQGLFLGGISAMYNAQSQGIVVQAVMLTFGVFAAMLFLYQARIIRVNNTFRTVITAAIGGIVLVYLVSLGLSFFGIKMPLLNDASPIGIGISLFIVGIAALSLALDFDTIEKGIEAQMPRYMEWYCAFGLMVSLIWLYLEILRLLSKINRR